MTDKELSERIINLALEAGMVCVAVSDPLDKDHRPYAYSISGKGTVGSGFYSTVLGGAFAYLSARQGL